MSRLSILTAALVFLSLLAPFFFPWPFALGLGVLAALFFPSVVIGTGALLDILYFDGTGGLFGHGGIPYFTIIGCVLAGVAYFVQQFVKTRIMS